MKIFNKTVDEFCTTTQVWFQKLSFFNIQRDEILYEIPWKSEKLSERNLEFNWKVES